MVQNPPPTSISDKQYQDNYSKTSISVEDDKNDILRDSTAAAVRDGGFLELYFAISSLRQTRNSQ